VALEVLRQALAIALESGNRQLETHLATALADLVAVHGDPSDAFDFFIHAIRNYHDSGSFSHLRTPLGSLATFLQRLGHHDPAATIAGFAVNSFMQTTYPEINATITCLREVLGDDAYESLTRTGKNLTNATLVTYALDQIEQARAQLASAGEFK
jgi:hypothetical protein